MKATIYRLRVKGCLQSHWSDWFDGMTITRETNGDTMLEGPVADQAALHGLFAKVRDLGLVLISAVLVE